MFTIFSNYFDEWSSFNLVVLQADHSKSVGLSVIKIKAIFFDFRVGILRKKNYQTFFENDFSFNHVKTKLLPLNNRNTIGKNLKNKYVED